MIYIISCHRYSAMDMQFVSAWLSISRQLFVNSREVIRSHFVTGRRCHQFLVQRSSKCFISITTFTRFSDFVALSALNEMGLLIDIAAEIKTDR